MSGPMLADKLTELQPGLKVLYISGYDNTHVVQKYVVEKGHELLSKPFTVEDLQNKVRELLAPATDRSLLISFGEEISADVHRQVFQLTHALEGAPGILNLHPAFASVLVEF